MMMIRLMEVEEGDVGVGSGGGGDGGEDDVVRLGRKVEINENETKKVNVGTNETLQRHTSLNAGRGDGVTRKDKTRKDERLLRETLYCTIKANIL